MYIDTKNSHLEAKGLDTCGEYASQIRHETEADAVVLLILNNKTVDMVVHAEVEFKKVLPDLLEQIVRQLRYELSEEDLNSE